MTKKESAAELRIRKLRATPARIALLDALREHAAPISAEELHDSVRAFDLVTVYRTLESFVQTGLVRELRFNDAKARYEFLHGEHHHHLVCTSCGTVDELEGCGVKDMEKGVLRKSVRFATVDKHALEFFGTCKSCAH